MVAKKKSTAKVTKKRKSFNKDILNLLDKEKHLSLFDFEIAEKLNISLNEVTITIRQLKKDSKVRTKLVMEDSRWITQVKKINDFAKDSQAEKERKLAWEPLNDLPCFICPYTKKCDEGQKQYNPRTCPWLTDWLICCINEEPYSANPFHPEYEVERKKKKKK